MHSKCGELHWSGCRSNVVAWGRLDPIPLCCPGLHLLSDIYHTVKSDITLVEEAPYLMSPKPISRGGKKEKCSILEGQGTAREHLPSIAGLGLCVPLSHWYFEGMHNTAHRAPRSWSHWGSIITGCTWCHVALGEFPRLFPWALF